MLILALVGSASTASADDGLYLANGYSMGAPSVTTSAGTESAKLTAFRVRAALGYRRGPLAIEPNLAIQSIDRHDYAAQQATTIYDYASAGAQLKYIRQSGAFATYLRAGAHHSWSSAAVMRPPTDGGGIDAGIGLQLGGSGARGVAGGFFLDLGHEITWIGPATTTRDRISTTYFSIGFAAGTGY